jgi:hypothetical protein
VRVSSYSWPRGGGKTSRRMREGEFGSGRDGNRSRGDTIDFDV